MNIQPGPTNLPKHFPKVPPHIAVTFGMVFVLLLSITSALYVKVVKPRADMPKEATTSVPTDAITENSSQQQATNANTPAKTDTPKPSTQGGGGSPAASGNTQPPGPSGGSFAPAPPPSSGAGCPAFPAFPDANCTGWQHTGVTLSAYTGPTTITIAGTVIDSKQINSDLIIQANNVTIKRSKVNGTISLGYSEVTGILIEDVEINAGNTTYAAIGASGFTCRRCNIYGAGQGINGYDFTLEDSYIHDLYGEGTVHGETILGYNGNIVVQHNRLAGNYNAASGNWDPNDGGMSSSVSFYTHGSWGPINNVLFEYNKLSVGHGDRDFASYCLYGGGVQTSNGIFRNNIFVRNPINPSSCGQYGSVTDIPSGSGSIWSNNKYEDGSSI